MYVPFVVFMTFFPVAPNAKADVSWYDMSSTLQRVTVDAYTDGYNTIIGLNGTGLTTSTVADIYTYDATTSLLKDEPDCRITFTPVSRAPVAHPYTYYAPSPLAPILIDYRDPTNDPTLTDPMRPTIYDPYAFYDGDTYGIGNPMPLPPNPMPENPTFLQLFYRWWHLQIDPVTPGP